MIYKVTEVKTTEDAAWQGLHRTWFNANGQNMYMLHQPGNVPKAGDELDGTAMNDKRGNLKFTKTKTFTPGATAPQPSTRPSAPQERVFKADPDKQLSIEWQAATKAAVEAVKDFYMICSPADHPTTLEDYKRDIVNTAITFATAVGVKPSHMIEAPAPAEPEEPAEEPTEDPDLPPVEALEPPSDINLDDIPF